MADAVNPQPLRRHGVLLGIAEIVKGLRVDAVVAADRDVEIPSDLVEEVVLIVHKMDKARLYRYHVS